MKSNRVALILAYDERQEVEPGVWENQLITKKIKAQKERVYKRRLDLALQEGMQITARFSVRSNEVQPNLKYVTYKGQNFKVNLVNKDIDGHFAIIEIGELI